MTALRASVYDQGLQRPSRTGDILLNPQVTTIATDANLTLSVAQFSGGVVSFSSFSAGRTVTTDTAANIMAANTWMDIGDSFTFQVAAIAAYAATWAAGTGVTLAGRATTAASTTSTVIVTKTSATTVTWTVI